MLAAKGRRLPLETTVFPIVPDDVLNLVEDDRVHSNSMRLPLVHVVVPFDLGVIRDCEGRWLCGFARSIGRCNVLLAELWVIHDGLLHAWSRSFCRIEIESDNLEDVRIVTSVSTALRESGLVLSIKRWLCKD
ncbi:hypothetical protein V6N13_079822 [Hibiscus sabdariffa]|uniref:RNase H type-1 domain-containing protein n=1 Tax=Hibiscus sabdariffa TaxID=183260 RepID=A0ABR2RSJ4_9ROSI